MERGIITKALSGFYYVYNGNGMVTCRARGSFRHRGEAPLVGDWVEYTPLDNETGAVDRILPRKNQFHRPAVANIDQLILVVSEAIPVTDPFLIDRVVSIAESKECEPVICINKCDLAVPERLEEIYSKAGFPTVVTSAETGEGIPRLREILNGKVNAFTGNSGVGKSSLLNALAPEWNIPTGDVSEKLGRGRHTTRHIEFFRLNENTLIADTPGFSSFDVDGMEQLQKEDLANTFREFRPWLGSCQFRDCSHVKEKGCAVLRAVSTGEVCASRHASYIRLYQQLKAVPDWERKNRE